MTHPPAAPVPSDPSRPDARSLSGWLGRGRLLLSAGVIALAAVVAPATPAKSQSTEELLALILGAAAVAVIVRSFDNSGGVRQRPRAGVLPDACLETVRLNRRNIELYHATCLGWYGLDRFPARCETRIRTNVGVRRYFLAQCLYDANYRSESGRYPAPRAWEAPRDVPRHFAPVYPRDDRDWYRDRSDRRDWNRDRRGDRGWRGDRDRRGDREWRRDRSHRDRARSDRRGDGRHWRRDGHGFGGRGNSDPFGDKGP
ncbi:hypothetical protein [Pararhodobacter sp. SW119]|uniref:hypothetical protein n=1 Tax=Pararhodobacter sp. SW119 TaxID=2780075 RepID=UPI001ADF2D3B|nr:hypothetical protein [Pararhodobacter sp. SW119]